MLFTRLVGLTLRALQLVSAVIVAGIVGNFLGQADQGGWWPGGRFVYTEVVAGLAMLVSLILLIPFTWALTMFPLDLTMFLLWIVSFGLLADYIGPMDCSWSLGWYPAYPGPNASAQGQCDTWKTALAFVFLSAVFWLGTALLAVWVVHRNRTARDMSGRHRQWYRSHY